jgi:hypothetical protein
MSNNDDSDNGDSCRSSLLSSNLSDCCSKSSCSCSYYSDINSENFHEYYYQTDEDISEDLGKRQRSPSLSPSKSSRKSDCSESSCTDSNCSLCNVYTSEFIYKDRLLNGAEKKLVLPSPMDLLNHSYFDSFRKNNIKTKKSIVFKYTLTDDRWNNEWKNM